MLIILVPTKPIKSCSPFLTSCTVTLSNNFLSWNPKFNYDIHNMATSHILSQLQPPHTHTFYVFNIHFNIIFCTYLFEVQRVVVHCTSVRREVGKHLSVFDIHMTVHRDIYSYNKSQQDALFLKFILVKISACFGQIYCPSSGVLILYSQQ